MTEDPTAEELPTAVVAEAARLTRLARRASDEAEAAAYRRDRDARLSEYGYTARVREESSHQVLVCYPAEWVENGTVRLEAIYDRSRAVQHPLSGPGDEADYAAIDAHNRSIVRSVERRAGSVHGANAATFADFMSNHYLRPVESASAMELREFLEEYYPRNAWPSDSQRAVVEESLRLVFEAAGRDPPPTLVE